MKQARSSNPHLTYTCMARFCLLVSVIFTSTSLHATWDKQTIKSMVAEEAWRQNLSVALALAVAETESNFDPYARSHVDARGVMQILPKTAEEDLGVRASSLYNPRVNIRAGVRYLLHLLEVYDGRVDIALSHYNGGSRVRQKDGSLKVIPATRAYVQKVLSKAEKYRQDPLAMNRNRFAQTAMRSVTSLAQREALDDFERGDPLLRYRSENKEGAANQALSAIKHGQTDTKAEVIDKLKNLVLYNQNRALKQSPGKQSRSWANSNVYQDTQMELANEW